MELGLQRTILWRERAECVRIRSNPLWTQKAIWNHVKHASHDFFWLSGQFQEIGYKLDRSHACHEDIKAYKQRRLRHPWHSTCDRRKTTMSCLRIGTQMLTFWKSLPEYCFPYYRYYKNHFIMLPMRPDVPYSCLTNLFFPPSPSEACSWLWSQEFCSVNNLKYVLVLSSQEDDTASSIKENRPVS